MATPKLRPNHRAREGARAEGGSSVEAAVPCGSGGCSAQAAPESHIRLGKVAWGGEGLEKGALTRRQHFRCSRSWDPIGSEGGVASFSIPLFFFPLSKSTDSRPAKQWPFPCVRQKSQPLPEMPHVQVAGHESHEDKVPPSPLSGRVVCGSVQEAVQSECSNAAETRGLYGEGLRAACVSMAMVSGGPENLRNGAWASSNPAPQHTHQRRHHGDASGG